MSWKKPHWRRRGWASYRLLIGLMIAGGMLAASPGELIATTADRPGDRSAAYVVPAKAHPGTFLRRDIIPFVGRAVIVKEGKWVHQFTCTLTGVERRHCVTTSHTLFHDGRSLLPTATHAGTGKVPGLIIHFSACNRDYAARAVTLGTRRIESQTERDREKDIAIIELLSPACDSVRPVQLLPVLNRTFAEKWLLPGAGVRAPVTIAGYYMECSLGLNPSAPPDGCRQYSSTGNIDAITYLGGEPVYETVSIATLPGSSGAPGLLIDTGEDAVSRDDDTYYWICLNVGFRPGGANACIALENGSFARDFLEREIEF